MRTYLPMKMQGNPQPMIWKIKSGNILIKDFWQENRPKKLIL